MSRITIDDLPAIQDLMPEQMEQLLGAGPSRRLQIEALESRELMASGLTASLSGGVLHIQDHQANDVIHVREVNNQLSIDGVAIQVNGVGRASVSAVQVAGISVDALAPQDLVNVDSGVLGGRQLAVAAGVANDYLWQSGQLFEANGRGNWTPDGAADNVQDVNGAIFFTHSDSLFLATGTPGASTHLLNDVLSLADSGGHAVVQIGSYFTADVAARTTAGVTTLTFSNVQLNLHAFVSDFYGQAVASLQSFTKPLASLANALENPLINGVPDASQFNAIELLKLLGRSSDANAAQQFADAVKAINSLSSAAPPNGVLNLGSFTARIQPAGSQSPLVLTASSPLGSVDLSQYFGTLANIPGANLAGLNDAANLFKLITGEKATLFSYSLSANVNVVNIQQMIASIPVSPVFTELDLGVKFGATLQGGATFGFDTSGFQSGQLAKGFFIQNAKLTASLTAGLTGLINEADLAGYEISGTVTGGVAASLRGVDASGKVYGSQIGGALNFSLIPFKFGVSGQFVTAEQLLPMLINQASPYLKKLVGTDYQVAADILHGKGVTPIQIAAALGTIYGIPPQTTAGVLQKLSNLAPSVGSTVSNAAKSIGTTASNAVASVGTTASNAANNLGNDLDNFDDISDDGFGDVASQANQAYIAAQNNANNLGGEISSVTQHAVGVAANEAQQVGNDISNVVQNPAGAVNQVENTVSNVISKL